MTPEAVTQEPDTLVAQMEAMAAGTVLPLPAKGKEQPQGPGAHLRARCIQAAALAVAPEIGKALPLLEKVPLAALAAVEQEEMAVLMAPSPQLTAQMALPTQEVAEVAVAADILATPQEATAAPALY